MQTIGRRSVIRETWADADRCHNVIITPRSIADALAQRAEEFVSWLLPAGEKIGTDWCIGSPAGEAGKSCKIALEGDKVGRWADFAGDEHGDLIDLLAAHRKFGIGEAIKEAAAWLGIEQVEWSTRRPPAIVEPERPDDMQGLSAAPAVAAWLAARKITQATAQKYMLAAKGEDALVFPYMIDGKLAHLKFRATREKKFWSSSGTGKYLFGWQALNPRSRAVVLTEGEMDALAIAEYGFQALSMPYGAGKKGKLDWIETEWERLERFDTIYLSMDWDAAGHNTVQELADRLGRERCRKLMLPGGKDANAVLMADIAKDAILAAIREAKPLDPDELKNAAEFKDRVIERYYPTDNRPLGFRLPWAALRDFRMSWGETTILAGYSSHGKSTVAGHILLEACHQGVRSCLASLEFKSDKALMWSVRQACGAPNPDRELISRSMDWIGENLWMVDTHKVANLARILDVFRYAHRRYGVKFFVLDNFSKLDIPNDDFAAQGAAINKITEFAIEHDVHFLLLHHLRKDETDFLSTNMSKLSLKGSSALGDMVDNIMLGWRNRKKEQWFQNPEFNDLDEDEQNEIRRQLDTMLRIEKHRDGGDEPRLPLWFDSNSHLFVEKQGHQPKRYVK